MLPNIVMHTKHSELELGSHEQEGNVHSKQFISLRKYLALCCRKSELFACFPHGPGGKGLVDNPSSSILLSQAQGKQARMSQLLQSMKERPGGDAFCLFICLLWKANACAKDMGRKGAENQHQHQFDPAKLFLHLLLADFLAITLVLESGKIEPHFLFIKADVSCFYKLLSD